MAPSRFGPAFGLKRERTDLHARIDARVEEMFAKGLVPETERLLAAGLEKNPTALLAIGYRQVVEYLRGERSLDETMALVKTRTRQFAKRQMTWFRGQMALEWVAVRVTDSSERIADRLVR